jgi:hypothetical protein
MICCLLTRANPSYEMMVIQYLVCFDTLYLINSFDSADLAFMVQSGTINGVILHEMGHVLGIGTLWTKLFNNLTDDDNNYRVGTRATMFGIMIGIVLVPRQLRRNLAMELPSGTGTRNALAMS